MQQNKYEKHTILILLDGFYPADIRVRKEAESLAEKHNVYILCVRKNNDEQEEIINKVSVLRKIHYKSFAEKGIIDIRIAINFIHPKFHQILPEIIKNKAIDVLHVHDLPLAKTGMLAAQKYNLKSVLDLHENYAAALLTWFSWRKNPIIRLKNKLFFNYNRWQNYENNIITKYDHIIAVVEEMKERIIKDTSISSKKITVITNSEKKDFATIFSSVENYFFKDFKNQFIISYVGGFGPHRGLQTAIEGIQKVSKEIPNVLLALIGPANKDVKEYLENLIDKFNVRENVVIYGSQPFEKVVEIMKSSSINIIPHISNLHTESTIPHKLFQILLSKKPILVSDCAPLKRIIKTHEIGSIFKAGKAESFAEEVINIHKDYEYATKKAEIGFDIAFNGDLNWEQTSKKLIDLYDNLEN
ncbi:glycosyltransferase family 4 protein [Polaribacter aestuariivivens]|uniref:Glycosyltransferase family 4 protein n=1 Tax=Polaribacter aestuariivivens TaxID=2304626 RepID=A0A5S3NA43_9FLAO|nr:glycosyltransferase [Polaribacter aestuariivivens]TMM31977.1 glycosyltransferase family 4 protein [Polaribacter aestuariivivens]